MRFFAPRSRIALSTLLACACGLPSSRTTPQPTDAPDDEAVASPVVVAAVIEPEPPPEPTVTTTTPPMGAGPPTLPDGDRITVADLTRALGQIAAGLESSPIVRADYDALVAHHGLLDTDALFRDYVRVRLVFESTRDGGLWRMRWTITNRAPDSEAIWAQWQRNGELADDRPTAIAECDELSALFAHLVHRLGVSDVGLFWPVWNHVVAVWTVPGEHGPVRIVVPTSQIFLDGTATIGTDAFDPWKQKRIYDYRRKDVKDTVELPAELVRFMIAQSWEHGGRAHVELQRERNARSAMLGGS